MKGAEAGIVLRSGLAQLYIFADDAHDVGLLLDELGKIIGHQMICDAGFEFKRLGHRALDRSRQADAIEGQKVAEEGAT
jgi:hypothetical protein